MGSYATGYYSETLCDYFLLFILIGIKIISPSSLIFFLSNPSQVLSKLFSHTLPRAGILFFFYYYCYTHVYMYVCFYVCLFLFLVRQHYPISESPNRMKRSPNLEEGSILKLIQKHQVFLTCKIMAFR